MDDIWPETKARGKEFHDYYPELFTEEPSMNPFHVDVYLENFPYLDTSEADRCPFKI